METLRYTGPYAVRNFSFVNPVSAVVVVVLDIFVVVEGLNYDLPLDLNTTLCCFQHLLIGLVCILGRKAMTGMPSAGVHRHASTVQVEVHPGRGLFIVGIGARCLL